MVDQCTLTQPLLMVIPTTGIHIRCPVHGTHFVSGSPTSRLAVTTPYAPIVTDRCEETEDANCGAHVATIFNHVRSLTDDE